MSAPSAPRRDTDADGVDEDSHLLTLMLTGDVSAFAQFYDRYSPAAYGLARQILADEGSAQDVLQDVFLAVRAQGETYAPAEGSVRAWLLALIRRHAVERGRQRPSHTVHHAMLQDMGIPPDQTGTGEQTGHRGSSLHVRAALRHLPAGERQAILRAYFGGQRHQDIARDLGVSEATVTGWLCTGLQTMRTFLHSCQ